MDGRGEGRGRRRVIARSQSPEQTEAFAKAFAEKLPPNAVVALYGDLGAGKTTFVRGLITGLQGQSSQEVCSPTFSLLNIYSSQPLLYHFDLYRIPHAQEFVAAGFDEYFNAGGICCIEWAEKIAPLLPERTISVTLRYLSENDRELVLGKEV